MNIGEKYKTKTETVFHNRSSNLYVSQKNTYFFNLPILMEGLVLYKWFRALALLLHQKCFSSKKTCIYYILQTNLYCFIGSCLENTKQYSNIDNINDLYYMNLHCSRAWWSNTEICVQVHMFLRLTNGEKLIVKRFNNNNNMTLKF